MKSIVLEVDYATDVDVKTFRKHEGDFIPFRMIGQVGYNKRGLLTMDAWKVSLQFNSTEQWMMGLLTDNLEKETNVSVLRGKTLTPQEKRKVVRAYKLLKGKSILTRLKREYYLINPAFFVPPPQYRKRIVDKWLIET